MPDISKARAAQTWVSDATVEINRASALKLVHQLLDLQGVTPQHKAEQLKIGLWKWTVAQGIGASAKFNTRYFSAGVMSQAGPASINHEHVWTMKKHVTKLLSRPWTTDQLKNYLEEFGVCCIVTVAEHAALNEALSDGWDRYREKGIAVYDRGAGGWLDLESSAPTASVGSAPPPLEAPPEMSGLIEENASPALRARLLRLVRTARFASAAPTASTNADGSPRKYFLIYDTLVEDPRYAVAYPHWNGRIDFALDMDDLPPVLAASPAVRPINQNNSKRHRVRVTVVDEATLEMAEELLFLALQKLRESAS